MPLHLLGKKSWNVYNADNIERVRRDEAIAAAHEEEVDRLMQEHDAAKRTAILRGLPPPPTPSPPPPPVFNKRNDISVVERKDSGRERKNRKLAGEDDTDRDIRLARIQREDAAASRDALTEKSSDKKKTSSDVSLYDAKGHINLFATDDKEARKAKKEADDKAEKLKKKQEAEEQFSMRLSDAAGRDGLNKGPWYASGGVSTDSAALVSYEQESKNVWGRPDPNRKVRDEQRVTSSDPLAFMKKAQVQLKESERDRKRWAEERARELDSLQSTSRRSKDSRRRRDRSVDNDSLEGFSLDDQARKTKRSDRGRDHHRQHRRRSRSPSPSRKNMDSDREYDYSRKSSHRHRSHHRERSRIRSREREHRPRSRHYD